MGRNRHRQTLIAIHLDEKTCRKNHTYAFPREEVTKEVQDALFVEWKNGGEYTFPENAIHWQLMLTAIVFYPKKSK